MGNQSGEVIHEEQSGQTADGFVQEQNQPSGSTTPPQSPAPQVNEDAEAKAAAEAVRRWQQSQNDKQAAEVAKWMKKMREDGITVSADEVIQLLSRHFTQFTPPAQEQVAKPVPGAPQAASESGSGEPDPVLIEADKILQEAGIEELREDLPGIELINKTTKDPQEFLDSLRAFANAYAENAQKAGNPARMPILATGAGGQRPAHTRLNSTDTLDMYYENFRKKHSF